MENDMTRRQSGPIACMERIAQSINLHDLDALVDCFEPDYQSSFPAHPDRAFLGREQLIKNWSQIFAAIPDVHATLLHHALDGDAVWTEWEWAGTTVSGTPFLQRGVTIQGVPGKRVAWVRLYIEPVTESGSGIPATR